MAGLRQSMPSNPLSGIREFLVTNLGEVEDKQFQLFEFRKHSERVLKLPATSHRFVKKSLQKAKRLFGGSIESLLNAYYIVSLILLKDSYSLLERYICK